MRIEIRFPDEVAKKVCRLPDRDAFVTQVVVAALATVPEAPKRTPSRWARLVERIEQNPQTLGEYRESFDRQRKEFREGFHLGHDDPE